MQNRNGTLRNIDWSMVCNTVTCVAVSKHWCRLEARATGFPICRHFPSRLPRMATPQVMKRPASAICSRPRHGAAASRSLESDVAPKCKAKAKAQWWTSRKGKKSLKRAMEFNSLLNNPDRHVTRLLREPEWLLNFGDFVQAGESRLDVLRQSSPQNACRVASFLLQTLITTIRNWRPPLGLKKKLGEGCYTPPRLAIMWHHVHRLDEDSSARMRSFGNTLFLRALTEGENLSTLHRQGTGETSSREAAAARSELASMTDPGMQDFFEQTLLPMCKGGIFLGL